MDVLSVGNKDYVKASVIARDLGYTADYVGQLCRNKKVNAKLVGRTWYVDRDSIHVHKENRYRSTHAKSVASLRETLEVQQSSDEALPVAIRTARTSVSEPRSVHRPKTPAYVAYSEDPAELIPKVSKDPVSIPIGLADAEEVKVTSAGEKYVFETPVLPEIRFQGKIKITDIEDELIDEKGERGRKLHPKWVFGNDNKKAKKLVSSRISIKEETKSVQDEMKLPEETLNVKHAKTTHLEVNGDPLEAHATVDIEQIKEDRPVSKVVLFATFASSVALVFLGLCSESSITVSDGVQTSSYSVAFENVTASAYTAYEDFSRVANIVEFSTNFIF